MNGFIRTGQPQALTRHQQLQPRVSPVQNHLLAALPDEVQERLFPHLELCPLVQGVVLDEPHMPRHHAYFPIDCIVSQQYMMENGSSSETSVVGNEGLIGIDFLMGGSSTSSFSIVQSDGYAYRLDGQRLKDEFKRHGELLMLVLRYTHALIAQMAQTAVCNRHHTIDQQFCRWLLLALDRLPGNKLKMTQEQIANTLGVRRQSVTEAAVKLQRQDILRYSRGHITVLDRERLEELSCECYEVMKNETDRLIAPSGVSLHHSHSATCPAKTTH